MILMAVTGLVLVVGIVLTLWWGGTGYETWEPPLDGAGGSSGSSGARSSPVGSDQWAPVPAGCGDRTGRRFLGRGARDGTVRATGHAAAGGDCGRRTAQGRLTDAEEVVGGVDVGGTRSASSSSAASFRVC